MKANVIKSRLILLQAFADGREIRGRLSLDHVPQVITDLTEDMLMFWTMEITPEPKKFYVNKTVEGEKSDFDTPEEAIAMSKVDADFLDDEYEYVARPFVEYVKKAN